MKSYIKIVSLIVTVLILFSFLSDSSFAANVKITSIKDLGVTVFENDSYTPPKTVVATMSNKTSQKVSVKWSPKTVTMIKAGTFIYKGTVKGYDKKVLLTVKVIAMDKEVKRAIYYGLVPKEIQIDLDKTITYAEFCRMLTNYVSLYDKQLIPKWQKVAALALKSNQKMQRDDGMLAVLYAAQITNMIYLNGNAMNLEPFLGEDGVHNSVGWWDGVKWDYPLFPGWDKKWYSPIEHKLMDYNYMQAACYHATRQPSCVDGSPILDFDNNGLIHFGDNFTRTAAIKAVLRLYESDWEVAAEVDYSKWCSEKCLTYIKQIDARRNEILKSSTNITYTGTAYYVSNRGSDENDGKTPATAWATVDKVNNASLNSGDAVFFERGGIWRGTSFLCQQGITYSAYGEGNKPLFTLSPEDGADKSKWTLYYKGTNGEKVWKFYRNMNDCGNLYFNGGESWAYKVAPHWRYGRWMNSDGTDFNIKKQLDRNHAFFSCVDSGLPKTDKVEYIWYPDIITDGPLFLRCDEGNPGEVFDSIEFGCMTKGKGVALMELEAGCTADNLCIRYVGMQGVIPGSSDSIIQNCDIGWCGGAMLSDNGNELFAPDTKDMVNNAGGGTSLRGQSNVIMSNYIHDTFQEGITLENDCDGPQYNSIISRNLIERTYNGILIVHYNTDENAESFWNDIDISDNIVAMSGFNWGNTQSTQCDPMGCGLQMSDFPNINKNLNIYNNLFFGCYGTLFNCHMPDKNLPKVYENTFCTLTMSSCPVSGRNNIQYPVSQAEKFMSKKFGNNTNKIIVVN